MRYPLSSFPAIPPASRAALAAHGIDDTDALLARAATVSQRAELAKASSLAPADLARWAGLADLVRVKGIGPQYAGLLLEGAGAVSLQDLLRLLAVPPPGSPEPGTIKLSERPEVRVAAEQLAGRLAAYGAVQSPPLQGPSWPKLAAMAEEAAELQPRLVLVDPDEDAARFREYLFARQREDAAAIRVYSMVLVLILAGFLLVALVFFYLWASTEMHQAAISRGSLALVYTRTTRVLLLGLLGSIALAGFMVFVLAGTVSLFDDGVSYLSNTWFVLLLCRTPADRRAFRVLNAFDAARSRPATRRSWLVLALLAVGLLVWLGFIFPRPDVTWEELWQQLALPFSAVAAFAIVVLLVPFIRFIVLEVRGNPDIDPATAQRITIRSILRFAFLLGYLLFIALWGVPRVLDWHSGLYRAAIAPVLWEELREVQLEVAAGQLPVGGNDYWIEHNVREVDEALALVPELGIFPPEELAELVRDLAGPLSTVVMLVVFAFVLIFVIPYLALGGLRRGLIYMVVLTASFGLENVLSDAAPGWFLLPAGEFGTRAFIAMAVFCNALFFEWLFATFGERTTSCLACGHRLAPDFRLCPYCGLAQSPSPHRGAKAKARSSVPAP